ncbi:MAG TPA: bifunctional 4-hydroxy-2-oxoglutarate aldolase/2-dehydro-3-deoxy-phosphogluconate aldolase [Candidatus Limnocylindrales bacterium]
MPHPETVAALRRSPVADLIRARRLIAILRRVQPRERLLDLVASLADDGVALFEVTFDAPAAADDLDAVRERLAAGGHGHAVVGAGTILGEERLEAALRCGAAFVVAPTLDRSLLHAAIGRGVPVIPGAYSPTEIAAAWSAGATFVKLFPASSLGPAHVRELRGPLPDIELIATGGVDAASAGAFLSAGCVAVGIGGALVNASPAERAAILEAVT